MVRVWLLCAFPEHRTNWISQALVVWEINPFIPEVFMGSQFFLFPTRLVVVVFLPVNSFL